MICDGICPQNQNGSSEWFRRFKNLCRENCKLAWAGSMDYKALKKVAIHAKTPAQVDAIAEDHGETYFIDQLHY